MPARRARGRAPAAFARSGVTAPGRRVSKPSMNRFAPSGPSDRLVLARASHGDDPELAELHGLFAALRDADRAGASELLVAAEAELVARAREDLARLCRLASADRRIDAYLTTGRGAAPAPDALRAYVATTARLLAAAIRDDRNRRYLAAARPAVTRLLGELRLRRAACRVLARARLAA